MGTHYPTHDALYVDMTHQPTFLKNPCPDDVPILEELYGVRKKLKIAVLGAGCTGLNILKVAEDNLTNVEIVCYENHEDVGGTWYENRYPGCACDIPSAIYQFPGD